MRAFSSNYFPAATFRRHAPHILTLSWKLFENGKRKNYGKLHQSNKIDRTDSFWHASNIRQNYSGRLIITLIVIYILRYFINCMGFDIILVYEKWFDISPIKMFISYFIWDKVWRYLVSKFILFTYKWCLTYHNL